MEPEGSLPHSQVPATCPYPEPVRPSSCLTSHFLKSILILSCCLLMDLPSCIFPSGFPLKTLYTSLLSPIRATCPAHLILLDFITQTILGEEPATSPCFQYKLVSIPELYCSNYKYRFIKQWGVKLTL